MIAIIEKMKGKKTKDFFSFLFGYIGMSIDRIKLSRVKPVSSGLSERRREVPIIVSLTSFPARIWGVSKCINTLLCQSVKPDKIILWLAKEQFPKEYEDLPAELLELRKYGLEIRWCRDIKSYKKLIPTLKEYSDCIIITADDDILYDKKWLELLYDTYKNNQDCIICHRITKVISDSGNWHFLSGGKDIYEYPCFLNKLVGCGGVLYPPGSLNSEIFNQDAFMSLSPTNDDIWFWCMGVLNGTKVTPANHRIRWNKEIKGSSSSALSNSNIHEVVREQFENILKAYPVLYERLMEEVAKSSY